MTVVAPGARIGFVGLGNLDQPMARALHDSASDKAEP